MDTPFLRRITLQGHATPAGNSSAIKIERRQAAHKPVALTLRHVQRATPVVIALQTLNVPVFFPTLTNCIHVATVFHACDSQDRDVCPVA